MKLYYSEGMPPAWAKTLSGAKLYYKLEEANEQRDVLRQHLGKQVIEVLRQDVKMTDINTGASERITSLGTPAPVAPLTMSDEDIIGKVNNIVGIVEQLFAVVTNPTAMLNTLYAMLDEVDRRLQDLSHIMEFTLANASEGYKLYKQFHEERVLRRKIKDSIAILEAMTEITQVTMKEKGKIQNTLASLDNRVYHTRASTPLSPAINYEQED